MKDKYVLKTRICSVLLHVFLLLMVAIILLPVCWLVLNSLKTNQEMFLNSLALPKKWMFVNYATAWGKGLLFYFKNSIIVSAISILCILLLSSMLAYGLTRFSLPGSGFVFFLILGGMALSEQVALVPSVQDLTGIKALQYPCSADPSVHSIPYPIYHVFNESLLHLHSKGIRGSSNRRRMQQLPALHTDHPSYQ